MPSPTRKRLSGSIPIELLDCDSRAFGSCTDTSTDESERQSKSEPWTLGESHERRLPNLAGARRSAGLDFERNKEYVG